MFDTLIRGGTIIDGNGTAGRRGDIAIQAGKIVEVGGSVSGAAKQTIDADGALVMPGFVDVHTHYDGQFLWDNQLDSSFSNGVTTTISGNCGVGFAPALPEYRTRLIEMMEGVEDIPGLVLDEGLDWKWRTFPDYLNRLDGRQYTMDIAVNITHAPLRVFVMGERALRHEPATKEDIAQMTRVVGEALDAGAVGFSAARIVEHRSSKGEYIPGTFTSDDELMAIAQVLNDRGKGTFQIIPRGAAGDLVGTGSSREERMKEHELLVHLAQTAQRPLTYLLMQNDDVEDNKMMLAATDKAVAEGASLYPQVSARGTGLLLTLEGYHIFQCRPSYMTIASLPRAERAAAMRDPARRRAILSEANVSPEQAPSQRILGLAERFGKLIGRFYLMGMPLDYEPGLDKRVDTVAAQTARTAEEVAYDQLAWGDGSKFLADFIHGYLSGDLEDAHMMLSHPRSITGLGDGGAHLKVTCDAALPTFHLAFWARDRKRGPKFPIETMVRKLTSEGANLYGLHDRGTLAVGKRADINVVDFDNLSLTSPYMLHDLPSGGGRLLQMAQGYLATMVDGVITRRFDADTGARPGRLYRS
jgi:N-acyl-D-amino-acid deacylase